MVLTKQLDNDRVLRRLKLSDLRLFHAVVERGGMARAAAHLNISQPAVSKAIAALEQTVGVRLLERHSQGVEPTVYGNALLKGGVAVFDELKQSLQEIGFLADATVGELRIGCTEPLAAGFLAAVIDSVSKQYPRIGFEVVAADPATLIERDLKQRKIELAIAPTSGLNLGADIAVDLLFDDRQVVMTGAQSKLLRRRNLRLADLVHEPWIWPPTNSIIGHAMTEAFQTSGLELPHNRVVTFSVPLCYQLLNCGRFLAMLPISIARLGKGSSVRVLDVGFPTISRPTGIVTLKKRTLSPLTQLFIKKVREFTRSLVRTNRMQIGRGA
jgi:DNA-binding transcriptional LysR family regulator